MLEYITLRLIFHAASEVCLTAYKGSTFRGIFKTMLKKVCCPIPRSRCHECTLANSCTYRLIAENRTSSGENTVLPYAFACSDLQANLYGIGEEIAFNLHLYGRAIQFLPYIVYSLSLWEKRNLGRFQPLIADKELKAYGPPHRWPLMLRPRGRLRLIAVEQITRQGVCGLYHVKDDLLTAATPESFGSDTAFENQTHRMRLCFCSPTRLLRKTNQGKSRKKQLIKPEQVTFELLFRSLLTRFTGLNLHFGNNQETFKNYQWEQHKEAVRRVTVLENNLKSAQARRFRRNNTRWIHLDGFIGTIAFDNISAPLVHYLQMGATSHIGKFPTMGYGEYTVNLD